jgi:hypothetical protein
MNTQEKQAVEDFAAKISQEPTMSIQCNQMQIEHRGFLHGLYNGVIHGAQFLDELRKPSEPETNVGEAGEELCTILPNPSRIKNDDAKLIDKIGFIIVTTLDKFRHKRAYGNSHITGLMMDEIAALMQNCENQEESRNISQTDKELLDALKHAKSLITLSSMSDDTIINHAISNYEKQSK